MRRRSCRLSWSSIRLCQKLGCWASLQDHIRNDVAVRSIPGSVVLYDCMLSRYTATWDGSNAPLFPLNFLKVSAPFAGHRIMPSTTMKDEPYGFIPRTLASHLCEYVS